MQTREYLEAIEQARLYGATRRLSEALEGLFKIGFPRIDVFCFFERMIREYTREEHWERNTQIVHALMHVIPQKRREKLMLENPDFLWDNSF